MKMLILVLFFIIIIEIICKETEYLSSKQECRLTVPKNENECTSKSNSYDTNFACCFISLKILNEDTMICDYLEYKINDAISDFKDKMKDLYNAKNIKISCSNNSEFFLKINILFIFLIIFI